MNNVQDTFPTDIETTCDAIDTESLDVLETGLDFEINGDLEVDTELEND